jgi:membrane protease YdiL (CAAX protease family)
MKIGVKGTTTMNKFRTFVKEHSTVTYFLIAYAITWSTWIPIPYGYEHGLLELTPLNFFLLIAGGFGPFLSAVIMTALCGSSLRALFSQLLKWRVSVKWWLAAFLIPIILYTGMAGIHIFLLGGQLNWSEASLLSLPGGFLSVFLWGGGNEELGWRGFALPSLQRKYNAFFSSIIIGVVWTLWHAPLGIIEVGWVAWAKDLPFYMISVTGISFVATWLYNHTGGSVLLPMVFHASVNSTQSLYPVENMFSPTGEIARTIAWILIVIVLVIVPQLDFFNRKIDLGKHNSVIVDKSLEESSA